MGSAFFLTFIHHQLSFYGNPAIAINDCVTSVTAHKNNYPIS